MEVIQQAKKECLLRVVKTLQRGGTVVFPTETAYGLGADPWNPKAVKKLLLLKGREKGKPLGLVASSRQQVEMVCQIQPGEEPLISHWPGPLSVVLKARRLAKADEQKAWSLTLANGESVSIRVSGSLWVRQLTELFGRPVIATSANRSGSQTCYSLSCVLKEFSQPPQPDLVIDGGALRKDQISTVARVEHGHVIILRQGAVTLSIR